MLKADKDVPKDVIKSCKRYLEMFQLNDWVVSIRMHDAPGGDENNLGGCWADPPTLRAGIDISRDMPEDQYDETVFHEVCHIILSPLQQWCGSILELLERDKEKRDVYQAWFDAQIEPVVRRLENTVHKELNG